MRITFFIALGLILFIVLRYKVQKGDFTVIDLDGVKFHNGSWQMALLLAQTEGKPIFLDVYATWCEPCKMLKSTTFADKELAKYMNNEFINVSVDGEKGEGLALFQKLQIKVFPTLLILNSKGNEIARTGGYKSETELMVFFKKYGKLLK